MKVKAKWDERHFVKVVSQDITESAECDATLWPFCVRGLSPPTGQRQAVSGVQLIVHRCESETFDLDNRKTV